VRGKPGPHRGHGHLDGADVMALPFKVSLDRCQERQILGIRAANRIGDQSPPGFKIRFRE